MAEQPQSLLDKARAAYVGRNLASVNFYYQSAIQGNPSAGDILKEYLERRRLFPNTDKNPGKIASWSLPGLAKAPEKTLETELKRLETAPYDVGALYTIGKAALTAKWYQTAVVALADILPRIPDAKHKLQVQHDLGRAYYQAGQYKAAIDLLQQIPSDARSRDAEEIIKDASASLASADFVGRTARQVATADSLAIAQQGSKDRDAQEIANLERILADSTLDPQKRAAAACSLADRLASASQYAKAIAVLDKGKTIHPTSEFDKKIAMLRVKEYDHSIEGASGDITALEQRRWALVVQLYTPLVTKLGDGDVHLIFGEALYKTWQFEKDEALLKRAVVQLQFGYAKTEEQHKAKLLLAQCLLELQLPSAAEIILTDFIRNLDPATRRDSYLAAHYELGLVRERLGDDTGALRAFMAVMALDIDYEDAFKRSRVVQERLGKK